MFTCRRYGLKSLFRKGCELWKKQQNMSTVCACASIRISPPNVGMITQPGGAPYILNIRLKSKGKSKLNKPVSETESDNIGDDLDGEMQDKNTKVIKVDVTSLRVDGILKNALGIARNKIETMFYESKIRVNGEKVMKKSMSVREGDELDIIKGFHQNNQDMLVVARVEILGATAKEDSITLKIRRYKSLIIENYPDRYEAKG